MVDTIMDRCPVGDSFAGWKLGILSIIKYIYPSDWTDQRKIEPYAQLYLKYSLGDLSMHSIYKIVCLTHAKMHTSHYDR